MTARVTSQLHMNRMTSGIVLTVLSGFSFATGGFFANKLVDEGAPGVVVGFYESVFGLIFVLAVNARTLRAGSRFERSSIIWIVAAAAGFALAFGTFYTALSTLDFSVASPILGALPLASYVTVLFVLRGEERITPRALIGATMVVAGVTMIGVAN
jgi:drug/metabolite transporter (DMT)-like permease